MADPTGMNPDEMRDFEQDAVRGEYDPDFGGPASEDDSAEAAKEQTPLPVNPD